MGTHFSECGHWRLDGKKLYFSEDMCWQWIHCHTENKIKSGDVADAVSRYHKVIKRKSDLTALESKQLIASFKTPGIE